MPFFVIRFFLSPAPVHSGSFRFGRKGTEMHYEYKDPYKGKMTVELPDDTPPEELARLTKLIGKSNREIWASDAEQRRHVKYSLDALDFEGMEYADTETPEDIFIAYEDGTDIDDDDERMARYLACLTDVQRERIVKRLLGKSQSDIAREEDVHYTSIQECLLAAFNRLKKNFPKNF